MACYKVYKRDYLNDNFLVNASTKIRCFRAILDKMKELGWTRKTCYIIEMATSSSRGLSFERVSNLDELGR